MSKIRDKLRKSLQEDLTELIEEEIDLSDINVSDSLKSLDLAITNPDTVETLRNKFSLPIAKKSIKFI